MWSDRQLPNVLPSLSRLEDDVHNRFPQNTCNHLPDFTTSCPRKPLFQDPHNSMKHKKSYLFGYDTMLRRSRGTNHLQLHGWRVNQARNPNDPQDGGNIFLWNINWFHWTAKHYIREDRTLRSHLCENLKSLYIIIHTIL
jgi:hypothetical protein